MRLLGGYGIIGLAAVAAQRLLSVGSFAARSGGSDVGVASTDSPTTEATQGAADATDGAVELVGDPLARYAVSLVEPGVVFFLGAALVFTAAWAYWYRSSGR
jgi:hypothetical protein